MSSSLRSDLRYGAVAREEREWLFDTHVGRMREEEEEAEERGRRRRRQLQKEEEVIHSDTWDDVCVLVACDRGTTLMRTN